MLLIAPNIVASCYRFVVHTPTKTAICADLHLGFEAALASAGTPMPEFTSAGLRAGWEKLLEARPSRIVVAGDLFHSDRPDRDTIDVAVTLLTSAPLPIVVVPGNHDPAPRALERMFRGTNVQIAASAAVGDYQVFHGHDLPAEAKAACHLPLIVGHQHPAVTFADRVQTAKMICFATIAVRGRGPVVVLPAFSAAPLGSNLLTARHWILDMPAPRAEDLRVAGIVREQVLDFGPLSGLGQS